MNTRNRWSPGGAGLGALTRSRLIAFAWFTVAILGCAGTARGAGQYVKVDYQASTNEGELRIAVTYTLWIPDGVKTLRGIIVHQHGAGMTASKEGSTAAYDLHWQALAKKWDCALLGPSYHVLNDGDLGPAGSEYWFDPRRGSDKTFVKALGDLATKAGHPELGTVPWALWGHSAGGIWADVMSTLHPERVVAVYFRSGSTVVFRDRPVEFPRPQVTAAVYAIPMMCSPGVKEKNLTRFLLTTFKEYRAEGAPMGFASDPRTGHECGDSRYLAIPFFHACLAMRLPDKGSKDQTLKPVDMSKAWLAPLAGSEVVPAGEFKGDLKESVWLPNEAVARAWMDYVKTGTVGDTTLPPAPSTVQVTDKGSQGTEIVWDAEADFESGIRNFIVLRDGKEIAQVPEKPVGKFGRPLFQSMTYHDTPDQPLPAMRYVDAPAKAGAKHTYTVITVNGVGLRSPASYPRVNMATGYQVDPAWPQQPANLKWGAMSGVAVDAQDNVWVLSRSQPGIMVYQPDGKFLFSWGEGLIGSAHQIKFDHQGNVWAADAGSHVVLQYTRQGKLLRTLGTRGEPGCDERHFNKPTDMVITPAGDVFVSDGYGNARVVHFDKHGKFVKAWGNLGTGPSEFSLPHAIALDSKGRLYVADRNNARIQVFSQRGKFLEQWRNIVVPCAFWMTKADELWVCGTSPMTWRPEDNVMGYPPKDQLFMKFDTAGKLLQLWSVPKGEDAKEQPGDLNWVHGLALDSKGNIYAVDVMGKRAQKFVLQPPSVQITSAADNATILRNYLARSGTQDWGSSTGMDRQAVIEQTMRPYKGESHPGVDTRTLTGKVMCGYQGWFGTPSDGGARGWTHWGGRNGFQPGSCCIDLWPDVSELDADERVATPFQMADGRPAEVFSPFHRKTVLRHFQWMQDCGIDGVFVQRFINDVSSPRGARHFNVVLDHCREGANLFGRTYAVMYDLSGMGGGQMQRVMDDWKALVDHMQITKDPAYLHHAGKPVVTLWGFGFSDRRRYTPTEGLELVKFLKDDPRYGGCTVMLGVPTYWRTLERDCVNDPVMHELILKADIVSPWTVGRYTTPAQVTRYAETTLKADVQWCKEHSKDYLPVVFPGFSWHNMNPRSPLNQIPRLKGQFLWTQFVQAKKAGATMVYQAMFDEVNEGTAIFKCTNKPPVGASSFVTYEGLPSDFYMNLVGHASRMLRGQVPVTDRVPKLSTLTKENTP